MSCCVQANECDMNMHAKIHCMTMHGFFVTNFFKVWVLGILCKALMHNKDLVNPTTKI
jgi:hypothetical protein